ncbi:ECF transporter S component [Pseudokineococcus basanitobsidens]|uniref:ECF transporter S component n=1 Tax=Pseudokineococcus basanitobsidens TaxID=1926649 RepID=A0ABU8RLW9_9ACTN
MSTTSRSTTRARGASGRWRVVDIVVCAVVAVAAGVVLWAWGAASNTVGAPLAFLPPLAAVLNGGYLLPALLGGLVVRRPGAALFAEVVAGLVSMLIGTQWGVTVLVWAVVQGLAAELGFALLGYRRWGLVAALLAGALAGVAVGLMDTTFSYPAWELGYKVVYLVLSVVSGLVLAGALAHVVVRALARTGALSGVASGRSGTRV